MAYRSPYQYETSPRKLIPYYDRKPKKYPKKSTARKATTVKKQKAQAAKKVKENKKQKIKVVLYVLFEALSVVFCLHYLYGEKPHFEIKSACFIIIYVCTYFE